MPRNRFGVRVLNCLALLGAILFLSPLSFGETVVVDETIVVHVLNGKLGQPLPDEPVVVHMIYGAKAKAAGLNDVVLHRSTDSNGDAIFHIPAVKPDSIDVQVNLADYSGHCACRIVADAERVLRDGVTNAALPHGAEPSRQAQLKPGEILFVVRPYSLLERMLYAY